MKIDSRRPRRQVTRWQRGADEYIITLEQVGHHGWQLTEHRGIEVMSATMYENADEAQKRYIEAQLVYVELLAEFTLAPLPKRPSEILSINEDEEALP
jgi:hypothetical protein